MENKIDIAKLLKDCPKGMELDCTVWEKLYFEEVTNADAFPISCYFEQNGVKMPQYFTKYGCYHSNDNAKCIIFPKDKTTWKGFIPPCTFKPGDVLISEAGNIVLFSHIDSENVVHYHCIITTSGSFRIEENTSVGVGKYYECILANEHQKQRMYNKIKSSGYKYNQNTNKLEKLIEFKDGDIVINASGDKLLIYKETFGVTNKFYVVYDIKEDEIHCESNGWFFSRLATTEEQKKLFQKLEDKGYMWNPEKKCLEGLSKFKNGDILVGPKGSIFIFNELIINDVCDAYYSSICTSHCGLDSGNRFKGLSDNWAYVHTVRFATEKEKEKLFKAIKDNNYKWNPDTKTLEKLPKFKIGDRIKSKTNQEEYTITDIRKNVYVTKTFGYLILFSNEDNYELISNKFDITTLIPFKSRVLFRNSLDGYWKPAFWGAYVPENPERHQNRNFLTTKGFTHYCIPYEGNEHLLGKTNDCNDYYKTWESNYLNLRKILTEKE